MRVIFAALMFILLAMAVSAVKVGVVIDLEGSTYTSCLVVPQDTDGYDVLESTPLTLVWSEEGAFGHALCRINGIGEDPAGTMCDWGDEYWSFYLADGLSWDYSPVGFDAGDECWNRDFTSWGGHYCAWDGDVIGLAHGGFGAEPPFIPFDTICPVPLEITDLEVEVDGDRDKGADEFGGDFETMPGDEVLITLTVENILDSADQPEVRDIEVRAEINNIGDDDVDEASDEFDLDPGDEEEVELFFRVPYDAKDRTYDLEITVEGRDSDRQPVELKLTLEMDVERERHDVIFEELGFTSTSYACQDYARLNVEIVNLGKEDEEFTLTVRNDEASIYLEHELDLGDDMKRPELLLFELPIKRLAEGSYPITLTADYDGGVEYATAVLIKNDCPTEQKEIATATVYMPPSVSPPSASPARAAQAPAEPTEEYEWFPFVFLGTIILLGAVLVILGLVAVLER